MKIHSLSHVLFVWLLLSALLFSSSVTAEETTAPSSAEEAAAAAIALGEPSSKAAVRELVSTLNDDTVRALLIQRMDAVAEAKEQANAGDTSAFGIIAGGLERYWTQSKIALFEGTSISDGLAFINAQIKQSIQPNGWPHLFMILGIALVVGLCAERLVALFFRKRKLELIEKTSTTLFGILGIIYTRLSFDILGVLAFTLASYGIISLYYEGTHLANITLYAFTSGLAAAGFGFVIARFFFAPKRPDLRICNTSDERAMRLTLSYSLMAGYVVFIHNFYSILLKIIETEGMSFMMATGLVAHISMYVLGISIIWYNRQGLTEVLLENKRRITQAIGEENTIEQPSWFAHNWPMIAIILLILKYLLVEVILNTSGVGQYSRMAVYINFGVIFLWPGIDATVSLFAWKSVPIPEDETPAAAKARRSMQQGLLRVGRVMVIGFVVFALARLWGLDLLHLAESGLGTQLAANLLEILLVILFAYIAWELVSIVIDYWLAQEGGAADEQESDGGGEIGGTGLSRVATILPIIQKTAKVLIVIVSIVMILDNWGVNIGPILAGAGVLGLAIGFGAQTLVKDIVSGMFFLADDAFRVGEYISVDGTMGNVEKISLRSLRLRHHRGLVHTIPYGEIPKLTNYSRDWVIMKLRFKVPFDTDVNKVKKIFKQIGKDLLDHPELGEDFLQPFKSQGVAEVDDNGLVVRGKFMAKPGKQFMIRKEVYVRVQKALEEAGIPFARKQVMVHIPGLENEGKIDPDEMKAIGAAAAEAAADDDKQPDGTVKKPAA